MSPRITAELLDRMDAISINFVFSPYERTMRCGYSANDHSRSRPPYLTQRQHIQAIFIERDFDKGNLNAVLTFRNHLLASWRGICLSVCATRDEHSGRVLGYAFDRHTRTSLVIEALQPSNIPQGQRYRRHYFYIGDRDGQFTDSRVVKLCEKNSIVRPMGKMRSSLLNSS